LGKKLKNYCSVMVDFVVCKIEFIDNLNRNGSKDLSIPCIDQMLNTVKFVRLEGTGSGCTMNSRYLWLPEFFYFYFHSYLRTAAWGS